MSDEMKKCQACGMPITKNEEKGTNADGSLNEDYCVYCLKDGKKAEFCQSCMMPLTKEEDYGTNADGSKKHDYCVYCYKEGKFTEDLTMDQMIERLADMDIPEWVDEEGKQPTREEKVVMMQESFPKMKRWQQETN